MRRQPMNAGRGWDGDAVKVLYVDDEPALLNIAKEFLEMNDDIIISVSTSASKVLEDAASGRYDVILSDYRMPEMDGIAFLKLLRERGVDTPFVIFTGQGREEVAIEALNNGADFYVQKGGDPIVQFEELHNVISQLAQRSRAERTLREREEILSLITDNMRDIVTRTDSEDRIVYISPSVAVTGFTPEEVVGHHILDFVHPDDVQRLVEQADEAIARREGVTFEYRQMNKDGSYVWSEARGKYLYDEDGKALMSVFSIRNVEERKRYEEELCLSNNRCQSIVDLGNVFIISLDREGRVTWMNHFAQQFFGFSEEEIIGRPAVGTIIPEVEEGTGRDMHRMIEEITKRTENIRANVNQNMKKNGELAWVAWTNIQVDIGNGIKEVLCTGVDITEQYLSIAMLGESCSLLQSIMDSIPSAILAVSRDGHVQAYNHQFLDMWGLHDKYQNMPPSELLNDMLSQLEEPEDLLSRWHEFTEGEEERFVLALKNGLRLDVVANSHHLKGLPVGRIWSFVDRTEMIKAQMAVAERESKFRGVFSSDAIGIGMIDEQGHIVEGNQALLRMLGYSMDELRGRHFSEFALPEEAEEEGDLFKEMNYEGRDTYAMERRALTKDGRYIWVRLTGSAVRDSDGRLLFGVGFFQDITAQKDVMERLRCSEERYRELARNLPNSMVMLYDRDLRLILVEGGSLGALGLSRSQMEGKRIDEAFQAGPFSRDSGMYDEALKGETTVRAVDYLGRTYRTFNMPLVTDDGKVYGGMMMGHDVTDLKRTEDELQSLNRSLQILTVGDRAEAQAADENEMYELVCRELVSASGHQLACIVLAEDGEWPRIVAVCGEDVGRYPACPDLTDAFWEALRTGKPAWRNNSSADPSGSGRTNLGRARSSASLPISHHGQMIGVLTLFDRKSGSFPVEEIDLLTEVAKDVSRGVTSFRDHADSVRSHRTLSRRGRQMQILNLSTRELSSTLDEERAIWTLMRATRELLGCEASMVGRIVDGRMVFRMMDRRGTIVPVNVAFSPGEGVLGRAMAELKPYVAGGGQGGEHRNLAVIPIIKGGKLAGALWAQDKSKGEFQPWDLHLMESLAASAMAALNNAETVRRLKAREDELEQVNRKLDLIGRITRHDLLNHLSTLSGYLELAKAQGYPSDYLEKALASASNIAKHLMFARDYAEVGKSSPEWVPLREAVRRGATTVNLGKARLEMEGEEVELYVDRMVEKVFHNLLDNSVRHGQVTAIRISAQEEPGGIRITYTDNGVGIPSARKEEVFDLAYSHHGLYLAREILLLTGIQIMERGEEGKGVRFEIYVPRGSYRRNGRAVHV